MKNKIFSIAIVLVSMGLATTPAMAREMRGGAPSHRPIVENRGAAHGPRVSLKGIRPMAPAPAHVAAPHVGLRLTARPGGLMLNFGGVSFIYNNGIFYSVLNGGYEVIRPSVGMIVPSLPVDHKVVMRGNMKHFSHNGILYRPMTRGGKIVYRVEGFI